MTPVLITVDTEMSAGRYARGASARANFESSILGRCAAGAFGIGWQMDRLDAHGLTATFFVDPLPALVYGEGVVADTVGPIVARKHRVELHIHTEWLQWARASPVGGRQGRNIADFAFADQLALLELARDLLLRAGAPAPCAFRAGNFGANDDTLRALAAMGLRWDSSVNAGMPCAVSVPADEMAAVALHGVLELPVSAIADGPDQLRMAQVCALSKREMTAALAHAGASGAAVFVIVTHSFEMLSRDRRRPNRHVMRRFDAMCESIARDPALFTCGFGDLDEAALLRPAEPGWRLPPDRWRTGRRYLDQAVAAALYERPLGRG